MGGEWQALGSVVARGIREVLAGTDPATVELSARAREKLSELRAAQPWAAAGATTVVVDDRGRVRWWTFAGWKANLALARQVDTLRATVASIDDLSVALDATVDVQTLCAALDGA